jgi:hypothetical protein
LSQVVVVAYVRVDEQSLLEIHRDNVGLIILNKFLGYGPADTGPSPSDND